MADINSTCETCVHNDVCRYAKDFEIIYNSLAEVAKKSVDKEYWQILIDIKIRCKKYVMAPYQEVKSKQNRTPLEFYYSSIKPDFMKTSVDIEEEP